MGDSHPSSFPHAALSLPTYPCVSGETSPPAHQFGSGRLSCWPSVSPTNRIHQPSALTKMPGRGLIEVQQALHDDLSPFPPTVLQWSVMFGPVWQRLLATL